MKQKLLLVAFAIILVHNISAQTVLNSKMSDNWFVGINGGANFKTKDVAVLKNLNPSVGIRLGRAFTPVFGLAIDGEAFMDNKGSEYRPLGTFVKGINLSALGMTNFSNLFGGYPGEPRFFEITGIYGIGWGHIFSNKSAPVPGRNLLTSKLGVDFVFNIGSSRAFQLYLEPHITYALSDWDNKVQFDINNSAVGLVVGLNYKFGNSNGANNFVLADVYDEEELTMLNSKINALREENTLMAVMVDDCNRTITGLKDELRKMPSETVVVEETDVVLPVVVFKQGKSDIDIEQLANLSIIANFLLENKDTNLIIKGYASIEGSNGYNLDLSEKRAVAVKKALVERFMIKPNRLDVQGEGATDKLFGERALNRAVVFVIK